MTRTKSSRALLSVVLAVLMAAAFMPSLTYSSFAATAKKATKVTKVTHADKSKFTRTVGTAWTLKYKLSPSKLTSSAKKVAWKSSNSKVAKITTIKSGKAVVSFKSTGSASVTVYTKANKKAKTTWKFKVVEKKAAAQKVAVTSAAISAKNTTVAPSTAVKVGTVLTADVAPNNATGVKYSWTVDGKEVGTDKDLTVTSDMIGKKITLKVTDDSNTAVTEQTTAAVSDATLSGVKLQLKNADGKFEDLSDSTVAVGETLKIAPTAITGVLNDDLTKAASIKWIRTTYSANGTAVDTTVAENQDTYTVTRADLAAKQQNAKVSIKAEVTPNTGVKAYGMTNGKFVAGPVNIKTTPKLEIQANGKTAKHVKAGTKLTAVTTPSDVKGTYVWYGPKGVIAGATTAEYTPTEDGTYSVHFTPASTEKDFDRTSIDSQKVRVGGIELAQAVIGEYDATKVNGNQPLSAVSTAKQGIKLYVQGQYMGGSANRATQGGYTVKWFFNGVEQTSKANHATLDTTDIAAGTVVTAKIAGNADSDFYGDELTSNSVTITADQTLTLHASLNVKKTNKNGYVQFNLTRKSQAPVTKKVNGNDVEAALGSDYTIEIYGSNNGIDWNHVASFTNHGDNSGIIPATGLNESTDIKAGSKNDYKQYKVVLRANNGSSFAYASPVTATDSTNATYTGVIA